MLLPRLIMLLLILRLDSLLHPPSPIRLQIAGERRKVPFPRSSTMILRHSMPPLPPQGHGRGRRRSSSSTNSRSNSNNGIPEKNNNTNNNQYNNNPSHLPNPHPKQSPTPRRSASASTSPCTKSKQTRSTSPSPNSNPQTPKSPHHRIANTSTTPSKKPSLLYGGKPWSACRSRARRRRRSSPALCCIRPRIAVAWFLIRSSRGLRVGCRRWGFLGGMGRRRCRVG